MNTYGGGDRASGNTDLSTGQKNGYRVSSPGVMLPARGLNHPPIFGVEVQ